MHFARFFEVRKMPAVFEGMELGMREPPSHQGAVLDWDGGVVAAQRPFMPNAKPTPARFMPASAALEPAS